MQKKFITTIISLSLVMMVFLSGVAQAALTENQIQSILNLLRSFGADAATVTNVETALRSGTPAPTTQPTISGIPAGFIFTKTLALGDVDSDVIYLKIVLVSEGCLTGITNTTYFGSKTKAGVQCFQAKYGTGSQGTTGPNTRAKLNQIIAGISQPIPLPFTGQSITLTSPNGGETWTTDSSRNITWAGTAAIATVKIDLYQGGDLLQSIVGQTANDGLYTWTIPSALPVSNYYKIRISNYENTAVYDESNANFVITMVTPSLTLASPNGGEAWLIGSSHNITWTSTGTTAITDVMINLYWGGDLLQSIVGQTANDGSYTWTVPTTLSVDDDYKIRITNSGDTSVYDESNADFSIAAIPQSLTLTSPNGGETWSGGTNRDITWTSAGTIAITDVKIDLYQGGDFLETIVYQTTNDGSYTWTIPTTLSSNDYKIRISNYENASIYDESNANLSIFAALLITSPNGGETWLIGNNQNITWTSTGTATVANVKIELYQGGYFLQTIVNQTTNDGSYAWTVPTSLTTSYDYKIRISKSGDSSVYDDSDEFFSIFTPLTVVSPNGTETWPAGTTQNITWTSAGTAAIATVKIDLYRGGSFILQITVTPNDGSYTWTIPTTLSANNSYKIRISKHGDTSVYDESNEPFSITPVTQSITVISPNGGETWTGGTARYITWTSAGITAITSVKIDLYQGGDFLGTVIGQTANDGSYSWIVPYPTATANNEYKVMISNCEDLSVYDTSDANFTIIAPPETGIAPPQASTTPPQASILDIIKWLLVRIKGLFK